MRVSARSPSRSTHPSCLIAAILPDVNWSEFQRVLADRRLPAALVDLDALDHNVRLTQSVVARAGLTLRAASKSLRHVGLIRRIVRAGGADFVGLMAYEGHIAGVPDEHPGGRAMSAAIGALKRAAVPDTRKLRQATVDALRAAGHDLTVVNGGGSGSLTSTPADPSVTEVTAGSGFVMSHLFDRFDALKEMRPAIFFALEVCRAPDPGRIVTLQGGGYIASGAPGSDKLPIVHAPPGLDLLPMEGAGEVQTPVRIRSGPGPQVGDPVILRHAKAGELAERFASYLLVREGEVVAEEPTYRGMNWCFY